MLSTVFGPAIENDEPTARNSNLLPVKANGMVRLRSPASRGSFGSTLTPISMNPPCLRALQVGPLELVHHVLKLIAEEDRDDGRRGLVGAEAVIVAGAGDRDAEQFRILGHGADDRDAEDEELGVVVRVVAGVEQVLAGVGRHRPVVVLAGAVDAGERLLVEQADQAVLVGGLPHHVHAELVVIGGEVRVLEDRRDFVLARRDFVVPRLDRARRA